jgi:hypothetical protein
MGVRYSACDIDGIGAHDDPIEAVSVFRQIHGRATIGIKQRPYFGLDVCEGTAFRRPKSNCRSPRGNKVQCRLHRDGGRGNGEERIKIRPSGLSTSKDRIEKAHQR